MLVTQPDMNLYLSGESSPPFNICTVISLAFCFAAGKEEKRPERYAPGPWVLVHVVLILKLFYTTAAMCELLLACEERVALRANVKSHLRLCGLCHECVSASTCNLAIYIFRMDSFFHCFSLLLSKYL